MEAGEALGRLASVNMYNVYIYIYIYIYTYINQQMVVLLAFWC